MPVPAIIDIAHKHLFSDVDKMRAANLPEVTINHLIRLRDIYNFWTNFPNKRDRDIVAELRQRYGIGDTAARDDLRLIKVLLGDMNRTSKDYLRYRANEMLYRAYDKADRANNPRDMIAAVAQLIKNNQLDKDDERADIIDRVVPVILNFTDDPEVIGITRMPNFREKIKSVKERYWTEQIQDIDFEEIDARLEEVFRPTIPMPSFNGKEESTSLPQ